MFIFRPIDSPSVSILALFWMKVKMKPQPLNFLQNCHSFQSNFFLVRKYRKPAISEQEEHEQFQRFLCS